MIDQKYLLTIAYYIILHDDEGTDISGIPF